jgi:hypothetical protein
MKDQLKFSCVRLLSIGLICGCATNSSPATNVGDSDPDCSFRSPATCWTVSSRFPERHPKDSLPPLERAPEAPAVMANATADSVHSDR